MDDPQPPILTVTQLNETVNQVLSDMRVWVQGEVSGYRVSQNKWVTFDLKDEGSKVNCFMTIYQLDQVIEDGMEIKVFGNPRIYVPYGKYSFTVQRVEPVGEGALRRAFELTKQKLEQEGVFDPIHKKALPIFPRTIGIVTSEEAAAYTDFLRIVQNRWTGITTYLRPSLVQGVNAPDQLVAAIEWFNKYHPVDVLVVTRGGGSLEDLQAFNSEQVCRAIFASRIPVIAAVGHERDITLAELAADRRASTPSNAAEIAVPDKVEIEAQLKRIEKTMHTVLETSINQIKRELQEFMQKMGTSLSRKSRQLDDLVHAMNLAFQSSMSRAGLYKQKTSSYQEQLVYRFEALMQKSSSRLSQLETLFQSYHPQSVLKRGYSITRLGNGDVLSSVKQAASGQTIQTELSDGAITSEVTGKGKLQMNGKLF